MANLSPRDVQTEILSAWLNANILEIFCYAAYTVVYILSVYLIAFNAKGKFTPQRGALAAVITVLWAVLTMRVGYVWHHVNAIYINHGASRDDELSFFEPHAVTVFQTVLLYILILLADLIVIWRTWAIYAHRWLAIVLPMLTMLTGLVAVGIELAADFTPARASDRSGMQVELNFDRWSLLIFSMVVCTNTFCTLLIIGRIIFLTGWHNAFGTYVGIINMLVESAFLYSGAFIVYIFILATAETLWYTTTVAAHSYVSALLPSITCFAPTLVILRVASGHSVTTTSVMMPSTGASAPIRFAGRTPDVDLESSNAGLH